MSKEYYSKHECPNAGCRNQGWYPVGDPYDPDQEQCEWCYTMPESVFNMKNRITDLERQLEEFREVIVHQKRRVRNYSDPKQVYYAVPLSMFSEEVENAENSRTPRTETSGGNEELIKDPQRSIEEAMADYWLNWLDKEESE